MIKKFKHKGLQALFETGKTAKIEKQMHKRIIQRLDALDAATEPEDMNLPGFNFHSLTGKKPKQYTVHVNGPWCIVFEFSYGDAQTLTTLTITSRHLQYYNLLAALINKRTCR